MIKTCIVVDDEPLARSRMTRLLGELKDIQVLGTADNGEQAVVLAEKVKPDLIFLDIEMPLMNGLRAAEIISEATAEPPAIIFCTAYSEFAIQAFDANAIAYLLKPVQTCDLELAIARAGRLSRLQINRVADKQGAPDPLIVATEGGVERLDIRSICYFRSEQKHTWAGIQNANEVLVDFSLKELHQTYSASFIRVHRNALVNSQFLKKMVRTEDGKLMVELQHSEREFEVSRRHISDVKSGFSRN